MLQRRGVLKQVRLVSLQRSNALPMMASVALIRCNPKWHLFSGHGCPISSAANVVWTEWGQGVCLAWAGTHRKAVMANQAAKLPSEVWAASAA